MKIENGKATGVKIAYIGGGSRGWAWNLMSDLAQEPDMSGEVNLYDIDFDAAYKNEIIGNKIKETHKDSAEWIYKAHKNIGDALTGANPNTTYKVFKNGTEITEATAIAEKDAHISVYTNGAFVSEYILDKTYAVVNYKGYNNDIENDKFGEGKYKSTVKVISHDKELKVMAVLAQFDIDSMVKCNVEYYTTNSNINADVTLQNINRTDDTYLMYFLFEQDTLMPLTVEPVIINPESLVE